MKPILYIANVSEEQLTNPFEDQYVKQVVEYAKMENAEVIPLCVKIEEELASLDGNDKNEMLQALGLEESGLDKVIKASYDLLGLMSPHSRRTRSKSMDYKKRYKSTTSSRKNT